MRLDEYLDSKDEPKTTIEAAYYDLETLLNLPRPDFDKNIFIAVLEGRLIGRIDPEREGEDEYAIG